MAVVGSVKGRLMLIGVVSSVTIFSAAGVLMAVHKTPAEEAREWMAKSLHVDYSKRGTLLELLRNARAVVKIRVDAIEFPVWNSRLGPDFSGNELAGPKVYSRVAARVEETWLGAGPEGSFSLLTFGDASTRFEGDQVPGYAELSGGFIEGQSFVVILLRQRFAFEDGSLEEWALGAGFEGNWRVAGSQAIGADTTRSMPLSTLKDALAIAWQSGSR